MTNSQILLGSDAFKERLEVVAKSAKKSLYVQAMTFEGDGAGEWLIETMRTSTAQDKKLLIDCYSKVVINDHFVFSLKYWTDMSFRKEVARTKTLIEEAKKSGIEVQFTNPTGLIGQKYPLRNHKKMVIVDEEISYLGGINFSDHNFAWHDMMIELSSSDLGKHLSVDFNKTWNKENQSKRIETDKGELYFFNGIKSKELYDRLFNQILSAKQKVTIISPYISEPLLSVLRTASSNGVEVTIVTPKVNNKSIFKNLILSEMKKGYFQLKEYPGMSHMKAILIDDKELLFGSSNYDLISYYFEQEVVICSGDLDVVSQFQQKIISQIEDHTEGENISNWNVRKAAIIMSMVNGFGKVFSASFLRPH